MASNALGCRDSSDELDSFGLLISGGLYFAGRSSGWRAEWRSTIRASVRWQPGRT